MCTETQPSKSVSRLLRKWGYFTLTVKYPEVTQIGFTHNPLIETGQANCLAEGQ